MLALLALVISTPTAQAYTLRSTAGGVTLRWPAGQLPVQIALDDVPAGVTVDEAEDAAVEAFTAYTGVMDGLAADLSLALAMKPAATTPEAADGTNVVRWVKQGWADHYDPGALAVTLTSYDAATGEITDADIVVNAQDYPWSAHPGSGNCSGRYDLQNVLTHEVGHLFGLGHEKSDTESTMYPSSGMCETKKRDLDADDRAGLAKLYVETIAPAEGVDHAKAMGCQLAPEGPSGALSGVLLVGAVLLGRRRPRLAVAVGLALAALVVSPGARATTVRELSLDGLAGGSVVVVRGLVAAQTVLDEDGRLYTDSTLAVAECLKGPCGALLTVRQLGGERDGVGVHVAGVAELTAGGEVVLMLRRTAGGAYAPLGMAQGAFHVRRSAAGKVLGLVHDVSTLRLAKPDGTQLDGAIEETVTMDDLRAAVARTAR